jgi:hypothetical protein
MLRVMDWSVLALGCALVLGGAGSRWWVRTHPHGGTGDAADREVRFLCTWLPLLMGLGMIVAKAPGLMGASWTVVEVADAVNFALAAAMLVLTVRAARRVFRIRREAGGQSGSAGTPHGTA